MGVQIFLPKLFAGLINVPAGELNWMAAVSGLAAGVAIAVLSALVPVRAIRAIKPVALFRGDTGDGKLGWKAWAEALFVGLITLAGVAWMVTAVTRPRGEDAVIRDLLMKHPEAMPVSLGAYVKMIESLLTRVSNILRFLTAFAVVAAGVILSGSLSATRFRRRKEGALLKALGASRWTVAVTSALENGLLGIVAGLAGGGLAYGMVTAAGIALKMKLELGLTPLGIATLAGGLLAVLVGVGATVDVLQVKPLSVLRSE